MPTPLDDIEIAAPVQVGDWRRWSRFSIKSLLAAMALVAVFLGGRASMRPSWSEPPTGTWQISFPAGAQRAITLTKLPNGSLLVGSGGNLAGAYRWAGGQLKVIAPSDKRFMGLVWQWDGDELVLVAEPANHPAGSSYVGTRLRFISSDSSAETQATVPTLPSRIAMPRPQQKSDPPQRPPRNRKSVPTI